MENREVYNALSEIKERTARTEEKIDNLTENSRRIEDINIIALDARNKAEDANKRMDKMDKWVFSIGSATALMIVGAIMKLIGL